MVSTPGQVVQVRALAGIIMGMLGVTLQCTSISYKEGGRNTVETGISSGLMGH